MPNKTDFYWGNLPATAYLKEGQELMVAHMNDNVPTLTRFVHNPDWQPTELIEKVWLAVEHVPFLPPGAELQLRRAMGKMDVRWMDDGRALEKAESLAEFLSYR